MVVLKLLKIHERFYTEQNDIKKSKCIIHDVFIHVMMYFCRNMFFMGSRIQADLLISVNKKVALVFVKPL